MAQCSQCDAPISVAQAVLSSMRADTANPACKDCVTAELTRRYRIVRMFQGSQRIHPSQRRGLPSGLTLAQAQAHCSDINTSSSTAWTTSALKRTKRYGAWFDGYEQMP